MQYFCVLLAAIPLCGWVMRRDADIPVPVTLHNWLRLVVTHILFLLFVPWRPCCVLPLWPRMKVHLFHSSKYIHDLVIFVCFPLILGFSFYVFLFFDYFIVAHRDAWCQSPALKYWFCHWMVCRLEKNVRAHVCVCVCCCSDGCTLQEACPFLMCSPTWMEFSLRHWQTWPVSLSISSLLDELHVYKLWLMPMNDVRLVVLLLSISAEIGSFVKDRAVNAAPGKGVMHEWLGSVKGESSPYVMMLHTLWRLHVFWLPHFLCCNCGLHDTVELWIASNTPTNPATPFLFDDSVWLIAWMYDAPMNWVTSSSPLLFLYCPPLLWFVFVLHCL